MTTHREPWPSAADPLGEALHFLELRDAFYCHAFAVALHHTNSDTRRRSRWLAKASRSNVIQRQLGHANLGITSVYLQGIDNSEIIETVHARTALMLPVSAALC